MMADDLISERVRKQRKPDRKRVRSRAHTLAVESEPPPDDPEAAATALLRESDARTETDPAPRDLKEGRVERRTSEDATPPPDQR
jgi:hypothetical protein